MRRRFPYGQIVNEYTRMKISTRDNNAARFISLKMASSDDELLRAICQRQFFIRNQVKVYVVGKETCPLF